MKEYAFVGKSIARVDAEAKVTGKARYTVDVMLPGMLWGRLLRSPLPHARIHHIDTGQAERLPGVKAVITGKDTPFVYGVTEMDERALHSKKVRFVGDPVAAVAAIDLDTAQEAIDLIKVEYEELPAVFDAEKAMEPGAPLIHDETERNIVVNPTYSNGNVEKAFEEADYVFENRFENQRMAHVCAEPHNCVAVWHQNRKLTLYVGSQTPSAFRSQIAKILELPESHIRIVTNDIGGGFGSRVYIKLPIDIAAIVLARKTDRPVKFVHTREEEFFWSGYMHKFIVYVKTGINKDGIITGRQFKVICDAGGYASFGHIVTNVAGAMQGVLYRYKNYRYDSYVVYTNLPYGAAFRGVGNEQVHFAGESQLNMIADRLHMDPVELRLKNAVHKGDRTATGAFIHSCGLSECIEKAAEKIQWKEKRSQIRSNRGLGVACSVHFTGGRFKGMPDTDFSSARISVHDDGSVSLYITSVDIGQGCRTTHAQIAAETLGIEIERIHTVFGDTESCPMDWGTRGSRGTAIGGMAVKMAAEKARTRIMNAAAEKLGVNTDDLDIQNSQIYMKSNPDINMSVSGAVVFNRYRENGRDLVATAVWDAPSHGNISFAFSFGVKIVELELNPVTGQPTILNVVTAIDLGKAINPLGAICQIEGGVYQGLGMAMSEEIIVDETGRMKNNSFLDYRALTSLDMPHLESILVETNDPLGPFGAKGLGEIAFLGVPEAFVGALHDACGVWIKELPITPEKVLFSLKKLE